MYKYCIYHTHIYTYIYTHIYTYTYTYTNYVRVSLLVTTFCVYGASPLTPMLHVISVDIVSFALARRFWGDGVTRPSQWSQWSDTPCANVAVPLLSMSVENTLNLWIYVDLMENQMLRHYWFQ